MGMPVTIEVVDAAATGALFDRLFAYFQYIDETFSTYKPSSEVMQINARRLTIEQSSADMRAVFDLAEQTKRETGGYFDIQRDGFYDPSGVVKGWAISNAAAMLRRQGFKHFYVEAGGDIQAVGRSSSGQYWRVGIRNPFNMHQIVKALAISNQGVATSGTYIRGQHIYSPKDAGQPTRDIVSLTVIGPDISDADRLATAAFAMGRDGIQFIERLAGFEGYMIDRSGMATLTSGFGSYTIV